MTGTLTEKAGSSLTDSFEIVYGSVRGALEKARSMELEIKQMMNLSELIRTAGILMMIIAVVSLLAAIIVDQSRSERKKISVQAMISALLLWYISWLIG